MSAAMTPLQGRRILVTGGATGIGAAAVGVLTGAGADVAATYHQTLPPEGLAATWLQCDVRDAGAVTAMVQHAAERLGGLDVLVNAAGLWQPGVPGYIGVDEISFLLDTNVKATILTNQAAYVVMKGAGGRIINFGSSEAVMGSPISAVYDATKGVDAIGRQGLGRRQGHRQRAGSGGADRRRRPVAGLPWARCERAHRPADEDHDSPGRDAR